MWYLLSWLGGMGGIMPLQEHFMQATGRFVCVTILGHCVMVALGVWRLMVTANCHRTVGEGVLLDSSQTRSCDHWNVSLVLRNSQKKKSISTQLKIQDNSIPGKSYYRKQGVGTFTSQKWHIFHSFWQIIYSVTQLLFLKGLFICLSVLVAWQGGDRSGARFLFDKGEVWTPKIDRTSFVPDCKARLKNSQLTRAMQS